MSGEKWHLSCVTIDFHGRFLQRKHACKHSPQRWEINCCGWLIADRFKPFTLPHFLTLAGVASVGFITVLQCGHEKMWNIPISEARVAWLKMFKAFQCQSIYCLREKKALAILESALWNSPDSSFSKPIWYQDHFFSTDPCLYSSQSWKHFSQTFRTSLFILQPDFLCICFFKINRRLIWQILNHSHMLFAHIDLNTMSCYNPGVQVRKQDVSSLILAYSFTRKNTLQSDCARSHWNNYSTQ